jgi:hypothetical protein
VFRRTRGRFRSNADLYAAVYTLRDDLRAGGYGEFAHRLDVALAGSTSGEIFGALRVELDALLESDASDLLPIRDTIQELVRALDDALQ